MKKFAIAAAILVSTSLSAMAAPFCLVITGTAPLWMYADGNECQAERVSPKWLLRAQSGQRGAAYQQGRRVLHDPAHRITHCGYADGIACSQDAQRQHGVCAKSAGTLPQQVPDPYVPNAGR